MNLPPSSAGNGSKFKMPMKALMAAARRTKLEKPSWACIPASLTMVMGPPTTLSGLNSLLSPSKKNLKARKILPMLPAEIAIALQSPTLLLLSLKTTPIIPTRLALIEPPTTSCFHLGSGQTATSITLPPLRTRSTTFLPGLRSITSTIFPMSLARKGLVLLL